MDCMQVGPTGLAVNPACGQLNKEYEFSLSLLTPENLVSRDRFVRPDPSQHTYSPHSG